MKFKTATGRGLLEVLSSAGFTEYGAVIPREFVHSTLGIEIPEMATKEEFNALALFELAAVDYCRNVLLGEGKYLSQHLGNYRILLPSENKAQVQSYMSSADKKLRRALKLSRNTPLTEAQPAVSDDLRIMHKRDAIKKHRKHNELMR